MSASDSPRSDITMNMNDRTSTLLSYKTGKCFCCSFDAPLAASSTRISMTSLKWLRFGFRRSSFIANSAPFLQSALTLYTAPYPPYEMLSTTVYERPL
uniref:Uncharacterized protein n=2 Tax=Meloidogyne incognita TaxID=6306 RepID=A0A914M4V8_MELIC